MSASFGPLTKNPLTIAISFAILEPSRVSLSQVGQVCYIVICINPTFTKMIDGMEKQNLIVKKFLLSSTRSVYISAVQAGMQKVLLPTSSHCENVASAGRVVIIHHSALRVESLIHSWSQSELHLTN